MNVAEVENLFICKEIMAVIAKNQAKGETDVESAVSFIIDTKFSNQITQQISKATASELKYQLSLADTSSADSFKSVFESINYNDVFGRFSEKYISAQSNSNYVEILKMHNEKGLAKTVGHFLGIDDKDYCELVLRLANGEKSQEIRDALKSYLPSEIIFEIQEDTPNA